MLNLNWEIVYVLINLMILYLLMKKFLFKPVAAMMAKREKLIADSIDDAKAQSARANELASQHEAALVGARAEAAQILSAARERAAAEYDRTVATAHTDAQKVLENARISIAAEREQAMNAVRMEITGLALLAAAKLVRSGSDEASDRQLVDAFVSEVGGAVK